VKSRRRSRIFARFALFGAATVVSTMLLAPGLAMAAAPIHVAAIALVHSAPLAETPALLPPLAGHRPASGPRAARLLASVSQLSAGSTAATLAVASLLAAGAALSMGLGTWLLEFVGKSSRTRGQPRMGELAR
jgi:hypothetical protein